MRTLHNNLEKSQFELYQDGQMATLVHYEMHDDQMSILSTQIHPLHRKHDLTEYLFAKVLVDGRRHRIEIVPYCRAIRPYMAGHPHLASLTPAQQPGYLDFVPVNKSTPRRSSAKLQPAVPVSETP